MRIPGGSDGGHRRARIEIIPLIDIMFFLLATFIMVSMSMIKNQAMPVNLPSSHSAKSTETSSSVAVTITREGKLFWNREESTLDQLRPRFQDLAADPEAKVFIHGDKQADFGLVVSVLDAARKAGLHKTAIRTGASKNGPATNDGSPAQEKP